MVSFSRNTSTKPLWRGCRSVRRGLLLACFGVLIACPDRSSYATCGDWLAESHSVPEETRRTNDTAPLPNVPCDCHGPMCSEDPGQPPLNVPDVEVNVHRDVATIREPRDAATSRLLWKVLMGNSAEREGFPGTVDRPPRFA